MDADTRYTASVYTSGKEIGAVPATLAAILGLKAFALFAVLWETAATRRERYAHNVSGRQEYLKERPEATGRDERHPARLPLERVTMDVVSRRSELAAGQSRVLNPWI